MSGCSTYHWLCQTGVARMSRLREYSMGTFCACMTHICMLGDQGHAPAMKIFVNYILWDRLFVATNTILSILPVCYMKLTITHANNWSLTFTLFLPGHQQIYAGIGSGVAMSLVSKGKSSLRIRCGLYAVILHPAKSSVVLAYPVIVHICNKLIQVLHRLLM